MPLADGRNGKTPYRVGLSTTTVLRQPAMDIAAMAIALGRNRRIEWSDSDDALGRILRHLRRDWGYRW